MTGSAEDIFLCVFVCKMVKEERDIAMSTSVTSTHHPYQHLQQQHGASSSSSGKSAKPCRYGPLCTRADCRYQHTTSNTQPTTQTHRYLQLHTLQHSTALRGLKCLELFMELHVTATYEITQCYLSPNTSEHTPP